MELNSTSSINHGRSGLFLCYKGLKEEQDAFIFELGCFEIFWSLNLQIHPPMFSSPTSATANGSSRKQLRQNLQIQCWTQDLLVLSIIFYLLLIVDLGRSDTKLRIDPEEEYGEMKRNQDAGQQGFPHCPIKIEQKISLFFSITEPFSKGIYKPGSFCNFW